MQISTNLQKSINCKDGRGEKKAGEGFYQFNTKLLERFREGFETLF